jgi:hypothetical protein
MICNKQLYEGYGYSECSPDYPMPLQTDVPVRQDFLDNLEILLGLMLEPDQEWSVSLNNYMGHSSCRLYDKDNNGSAEYTISNNNVTFNVPCGIFHYYKDHNVQPSDDFLKFVMNFNIYKLKVISFDTNATYEPTNYNMLRIMSGMTGMY